MPKWFYGAILSGLLVALAAGAFVWYADKPSTYNECLVTEMRGQSAQMMYAVSKMCAIKFHKEEELPLSLLKDKLDFMLLPDFKADPKAEFIGSTFEKAPMLVTIPKNETNYDVTRLRMKYAYKLVDDCSTLPDDDWDEEQDAVFSKGVANIAVPTEWNEKVKLHVTPKCIRFIRIWGTPRE